MVSQNGGHPSLHDRGPSPKTVVDETQLLACVRLGDSAAERAPHDAHVDRVYRLAFRLAGDDTLAQDFTQETFIRAFDRLGAFRGDAAFSTWLQTIATRVVFDRLRKVKRFRQREAEMEDALEIGTLRRQTEPDLQTRLKQGINELPEGCRTVFVMHDVEGYMHEEIGAALGVETGTSKSQLSAARAKLRVALAEFAGEWVP